MKTLELVLSATLALGVVTGCCGEKQPEKKEISIVELKAPKLCAGEVDVQLESMNHGIYLPVFYCKGKDNKRLVCPQEYSGGVNICYQY